MLSTRGSIVLVCFQRNFGTIIVFKVYGTNNALEEWHYKLNSNVSNTNPKLCSVLEELKNDYIFNVTALVQVKHQENKQRRKKKYILRHRIMISCMDRYINGSLALDDEYVIKISRTIRKRKMSSDSNISSTENLP